MIMEDFVNLTQQCAPHEESSSAYNSPIIIITCILGFIGNAIALWIFCFHVKTWKPNTVYSLNLAIADTLLICCLPFRAGYYIRKKDWIFGDVACRLNIFMISLNRIGSIIFLMVIAIDRYFKVVHPQHKANKLTPRCAAKIAGALWVMAVAICTHLLVERHDFQRNNSTFCEPFNIDHPLNPTAIWTDAVFIFFKFILPVSVILFSTSCIIWRLRQMESDMRGKYKRATKLVIAVAAVFIVCFLPTNIAVVAVLITRLRSSVDCKSYVIAVNIFYNTLFMTYLNSVIDPVIYYFSSSAFKGALKKALAPFNVSLSKSTTDQEMDPRESKAEPSKDRHLSSDILL
ncbi:hydroxycarboxylic acid receptor 2-like [Leucoraja erinacea]|uniref:hydroxycarboxylic acid receptor 2-like n=1 Tax=Leucoraja erinaceus TaxID=7782 RepID=UPI002456FC57|nr:hydroxycarboxylic acid receptor 2-like [Leucoraja erinacea]